MKYLIYISIGIILIALINFGLWNFIGYIIKILGI